MVIIIYVITKRLLLVCVLIIAMGSCVCVQSSSEWPRNTESASCGSEPAFLANAASSVMSVALASPTKVAWTGLGTGPRWTLPKPCSGKKVPVDQTWPSTRDSLVNFGPGVFGFLARGARFAESGTSYWLSQIQALGL